MTETIKFTDDEMNALANLQKRQIEATLRFGELHLQRENLNDALLAVKEELNVIRNDERVLVDSLEKKYGNGRLNLTTGEFTPVDTASIT